PFVFTEADQLPQQPDAAAAGAQRRVIASHQQPRLVRTVKQSGHRTQAALVVHSAETIAPALCSHQPEPFFKKLNRVVKRQSLALKTFPVNPDKLPGTQRINQPVISLRLFELVV